MTKKKSRKTKENKANKDIEKLEQDLQEMTETAKRAMADMQNMRRRQEEAKNQIFSMASAEIIKEMLPIIDSINLAKKHMPKAAEDWFKGIEMSLNQLEEIFKKLGLQEIESIKKEFDPDKHEAIAEGPGEKNKIIEEIEKGYMLGDRIIRHAKVKVGNGEKE